MPLLLHGGLTVVCAITFDEEFFGMATDTLFVNSNLLSVRCKMGSVFGSAKRPGAS